MAIKAKLAQPEWKGWPSGDYTTVLEIAGTSGSFANDYDLEFHRYQEPGIGWSEAAHFCGGDLGPVMITAHDVPPPDGAWVYVDQGIDHERAIRRLADVMRLGVSDIRNAIVDIWSQSGSGTENDA